MMTVFSVFIYIKQFFEVEKPIKISLVEDFFKNVLFSLFSLTTKKLFIAVLMKVIL